MHLNNYEFWVNFNVLCSLQKLACSDTAVCMQVDYGLYKGTDLRSSKSDFTTM